VLSNLKSRIFDAGVIDTDEMDAVVNAVLADDASTHETLYAETDLAVGRYLAIEEEDEREDFRTALRDFQRMYAFLAHIVPVNSVDMERLYLYSKVLLPRLPRSKGDTVPDLSYAAVLTHLRMEKGDLHNVSLKTVTDEDSEITGHTGEGRGKGHDEPLEKLSSIIEVLNEKFGLNLTDADQLFFEQIETEVANNTRAQDVALNNDLDQFMTVFDDLLEGVIIDRHTANDALLTAFLDKPEFRDALTRMIGNEFYKTIRAKAAVG
jgi:type I restriction enzyme R subunit